MLRGATTECKSEDGSVQKNCKRDLFFEKLSEGYDAVYYTYNSANQVLSIRACDPLRQHTTWYGYDANGMMEKMWSKLGAVGTGVGTSSVAHPVALTKPSVEDMTYSYDQMGRVEQMVYTPENIITKYEYHKRGWLDSMFAVPSALPTDTLFKQSLSRDAVGRIVGQRSLQKGQSALEESYKYDALNQLIEWNADGVKIPYSYDDVGNRLSDDEQGATRSYSYSGAKPNQLTAIWLGTKEIKYGYDHNGSATSRIVRDNGVVLQDHRYTYTSGGLVQKFEDVLPSTAGTVCAGAGVSQNVQRYEWGYRYSASGGREQKRMLVSPHGDACGSSHVWGYYLLGAGGEPLALYGGRQTSEALCGGTGRRVYMYAEAYNSLGCVASVVTRADGSKELNLTDHLGSVRTVIKSGGTLAQYDYKPYGALRWSNSSGYKHEGYIGKEEDAESSLGDYGARKYDATTGRFMSVDALYEMQMGWSPYHYAYNDPVNGSDGSGMFTQSVGSGSGLDDLFAVGEEGRREIAGFGGTYDRIYSGGWMTYAGEYRLSYEVDSHERLDAIWAAVVARSEEVRNPTPSTSDESSVEKGDEPYIVNNSDYVIYFKPESDMVINGVKYKDGGAYPLGPGESWYYPIDGVKTHLYGNRLFKITTGASVTINRRGEVDMDFYGLGEILSVIRGGWYDLPPAQNFEALCNSRPYKP